MKNLLLIVIIALFFGGCSYKNQTIALKPYEADYTGAVSKEKKSVYIAVVKDMRADKRDIGYAEANDKKEATFHSDVDFAQRYKDGLTRALHMAGFDTNVDPQNASLMLEVYIKDIKMVYTNKTFEENLKGELTVNVVIKKGTDTVTLNFKESGGKWIAPSYDAKDIEPLLYTLFATSINDIVSKLTKY